MLTNSENNKTTIFINGNETDYSHGRAIYSTKHVKTITMD